MLTTISVDFFLVALVETREQSVLLPGDSFHYSRFDTMLDQIFLSKFLKMTLDDSTEGEYTP